MGGKGFVDNGVRGSLSVAMRDVCISVGLGALCSCTAAYVREAISLRTLAGENSGKLRTDETFPVLTNAGCRVPHPCAAFCARAGFRSPRPLGIFWSHMTENQETSRPSPCFPSPCFRRPLLDRSRCSSYEHTSHVR